MHAKSLRSARVIVFHLIGIVSVFAIPIVTLLLRVDPRENTPVNPDTKIMKLANRGQDGFSRRRAPAHQQEALIDQTRENEGFGDRQDR